MLPIGDTDLYTHEDLCHPHALQGLMACIAVTFSTSVPAPQWEKWQWTLNKEAIFISVCCDKYTVHITVYEPV